MLISEAILRDRIYKIHSGMQSRAKPRYFKSGNRMGAVSRHGLDKLPFTKEELWALAVEQVSMGVILCPYCKAIGRNAFPITLENCVFDHYEPLGVVGLAGWQLSNLRCCCADCNNCKGKMSYACFIGLMKWLESLPPTSHDRTYLLKCLRTHGVAQQFQRGKGKPGGRGKPAPAPPMFEEDF